SFRIFRYRQPASRRRGLRRKHSPRRHSNRRHNRPLRLRRRRNTRSKDNSNRPAFHHSNSNDENHMKKISSRTYKIGGGIAVVLLALFAILARSKSDNASAAETTKTETMVVGPENITVATTGSIMAGASISGGVRPQARESLRVLGQGSVLQYLCAYGRAY